MQTQTMVVKQVKTSIEFGQLETNARCRKSSDKPLVIKNLRKLAAIKKIKPLAWLQLAVAKDTERVVLTTPHVVCEKTYASDGFRLHIVPSVVIGFKPADGQVPDFNMVIPDYDDNTPSVKVDCQELAYALTSCGVYAKYLLGQVAIASRDNKLTVSSNAPEFGNISVELDCVSKDTLSFKVNCDYLIDAIRGMGDSVVIQQDKSNHPVLLTGDNTAVIMPFAT